MNFKKWINIRNEEFSAPTGWTKVRYTLASPRYSLFLRPFTCLILGRTDSQRDLDVLPRHSLAHDKAIALASETHQAYTNHLQQPRMDGMVARDPRTLSSTFIGFNFESWPHASVVQSLPKAAHLPVRSTVAFPGQSSAILHLLHGFTAFRNGKG